MTLSNNRQSKILQLILCALLFVFFSRAAQSEKTDKSIFQDHQVTVYEGKTLIPDGYRFSGGVWFDEIGKATNAPSINFSGKYLIGLHSCGQGCRYYTLTDLITGNYNPSLEIFSSGGETQSKTKPGSTYYVELLFKRHSNLLIAQRYTQLKKEEVCMETHLIFEDSKLRTIKDNQQCRKYQ
ncbi:hypothetical protein [Aquipseudomonas alcaligenes]|uniref:Uncharacterized protein n=1 Tax=Aquipseudomonas alcaligenes TaxID=43263 RepID=A0A5C7W0A8_AQUAC|nr:hypothetical protein [Pseudomonas alcaligenes]MDH1056824.1 hypothetical protein [Pseudomonas alcaligenes]TXI31301.1 MAG: hypothetical protein E6Q69_11765 [Pseudomonas alcaligenes]